MCFWSEEILEWPLTFIIQSQVTTMCCGHAFLEEIWICYNIKWQGGQLVKTTLEYYIIWWPIISGGHVLSPAVCWNNRMQCKHCKTRKTWGSILQYPEQFVEGARDHQLLLTSVALSPFGCCTELGKFKLMMLRRNIIRIHSWTSWGSLVH